MLTDYTLDVFDLFGVEYEPAATVSKKKTCSKCGEDKPLSEYSRRKGSRDGVRNDCKACQYERTQAWREANRAKINAKAQVWREAHRAEAVAYAREHRVENREKIAATLKARRQANIEMFRSRERAYYRADKEKHAARWKEYGRKYNEANRERIAARKREYNEANRERIAAHKREKSEAMKHPRVYCIIFANGCYYIGKSNRPDLRFSQHKSKSARGCHTVALNEQDWSTATWRVLVECDTDDEALEVESEIIEEHMDDPKNLNVTVRVNRSRLFWVYVIQSADTRVSEKTGKTLMGPRYVGMTVDPARRLRQHNREIVGGARATSKHRNWQARALFGPYPSRSEALRAEYTLKRKRGEARLRWTPEDSPLCCGEGVDHPWVADPVGWRPPKE